MSGTGGKVDLNKKRVWRKRDLINFGKYSGKTVGEILQEDPGYLVWCDKNIDWFHLNEPVLEEAERLQAERRGGGGYRASGTERDTYDHFRQQERERGRFGDNDTDSDHEPPF